jgi:hypothetical protein
MSQAALANGFSPKVMLMTLSPRIAKFSKGKQE